MIVLILSALLAGAGSYLIYRKLEPELPDITVLSDIKLQVPLSVYSEDEKLIAQFGEKKRIPVANAKIPRRLMEAFIAAEDDRFFNHPGVDYQGLVRAAVHLMLTGHKSQGGSTITMQVARNFFLTREKTFMRKLKEILLALKIERHLTKLEIFGLYLNKIYLGHRAYGIGAAAQVYYGKSVDELSLAECAMIAGLPKAPSQANPITNPERALERRDYVLNRMAELGYITREELDQAWKQPVAAKLHGDSIELTAPYVAEMVRQKMVEKYGPDAFTSGFKVYTTLSSRLQTAALNALRQTLHEYDERHGYRGSEGRIPARASAAEIQETLAAYQKVGDTLPGVVISVNTDSVVAEVLGAGRIQLSREGMNWARRYINENSRGPSPSSPAQIVAERDVIRVRRNPEGTWMLTQIPDVSGALVSLKPSDGAIVALIGGFDFDRSKYNRVVQAKRQPGSGFKPILYTTALEEGFTVSTVINDAPIVYVDPWTSKAWRPKNYSGKFYGPTRLRDALRMSRNLVSVRLLRQIGVEKVAQTAMQFGLPSEQIPRSLSLALGSGSATPLEMARVYSVFANGGFLIEPYFIARIESRDGELIDEAFPRIACPHCGDMGDQNQLFAPRVVSPQINYLMTSLLKDVIQNGTATRAKKLGRLDIAGKTGTTNEQRDAWFNGFSPAYTTITWVGFDSSKPLGNRETGGQAALPMWMYYTEEALKNIADEELPVPEGIKTAYVNRYSGFLSSASDPDAIPEIFREEDTPGSGNVANGFTPFISNQESENSQIESIF
ncbi:MAG: penicillin-binding protein 1A [Methylococcaceae bacterium]|nr:penicillin-binding protein 1A [Methylococcaceae bacterium]